MSAPDDRLLEEAVSAHGAPLYFLDLTRVQENYRRAARALAAHHERTLIAYSYKTNYLPAICRTIRDLGGGAEVVCDLELELALRLDVPRERIVYNGPIKDTPSIRKAVRERIRLIQVETLEECERVAACARETAWRAPIGVRVR